MCGLSVPAAGVRSLGQVPVCAKDCAKDYFRAGRHSSLAPEDDGEDRWKPDTGTCSWMLVHRSLRVRSVCVSLHPLEEEPRASEVGNSTPVVDQAS